LKKTQSEKEVTFIGDFLLIFKYRNFGVSTTFYLTSITLIPVLFIIIPSCFLLLKELESLPLKAILLLMMVKKFLMVILNNY
jgi:hypothetical protein